MNTLDKDHFYPSMDTAVAAITAIDTANDQQTQEPEQPQGASRRSRDPEFY